jgi:hypothetical protein
LRTTVSSDFGIGQQVNGSFGPYHGAQPGFQTSVAILQN